MLCMDFCDQSCDNLHAWTVLCVNHDWIVEALDNEEGAFLQGNFQNGEVMYVYADVLDGMNNSTERKTHKFYIVTSGRAGSNYAANTDDRRSMCGGRMFLENFPVIFRSATQKFATLSVTEAETAAGVT